jgi:hypothetical protein
MTRPSQRARGILAIGAGGMHAKAREGARARASALGRALQRLDAGAVRSPSHGLN